VNVLPFSNTTTTEDPYGAMLPSLLTDRKDGKIRPNRHSRDFASRMDREAEKHLLAVMQQRALLAAKTSAFVEKFERAPPASTTERFAVPCNDDVFTFGALAFLRAVCRDWDHVDSPVEVPGRCALSPEDRDALMRLVWFCEWKEVHARNVDDDDDVHVVRRIPGSRNHRNVVCHREDVGVRRNVDHTDPDDGGNVDEGNVPSPKRKRASMEDGGDAIPGNDPRRDADDGVGEGGCGGGNDGDGVQEAKEQLVGVIVGILRKSEVYEKEHEPLVRLIKRAIYEGGKRQACVQKKNPNTNGGFLVRMDRGETNLKLEIDPKAEKRPVHLVREIVTGRGNERTKQRDRLCTMSLIVRAIRAAEIVVAAGATIAGEAFDTDDRLLMAFCEELEKMKGRVSLGKVENIVHRLAQAETKICQYARVMEDNNFFCLELSDPTMKTWKRMHGFEKEAHAGCMRDVVSKLLDVDTKRWNLEMLDDYENLLPFQYLFRDDDSDGEQRELLEKAKDKFYGRYHA